MELLRWMLIGLLVLVALVSVAFIGYTSLNPHVVTVTQQQFLTNTQNFYNTQTVTSVSILTSFQTVTSAAATGYGNGNIGPGYTGNPNCSYYGCYYTPSYASPNDLCKSTAQSGVIQCSGYLYEASNVCTELAIPYINPEFLETTAYLYLTLINLPSNLPPSGTWLTVTGQLNQGYSPGNYGPICTHDSINVASIS